MGSTIEALLTLPESGCPECGSAMEISHRGLQLAEVAEFTTDGDVVWNEFHLSGEWVGPVASECDECGHKWGTLPTEPLALDRLDSSQPPHIRLLRQIARRYADIRGDGHSAVDAIADVLSEEGYAIFRENVCLVVPRDQVARWARLAERLEELAAVAEDQCGQALVLAERLEELAAVAEDQCGQALVCLDEERSELEQDLADALTALFASRGDSLTGFIEGGE